jgi:DNA mismatch endonuclease, patch repair protein
MPSWVMSVPMVAHLPVGGASLDPLILPHRDRPGLSPFMLEYDQSLIRGKDTRPEMLVRRSLHALGYRFRVHVRSLCGVPDLVFPGRRKVIFVHGCFWHRHRCRYGQVTPTTRRRFWMKKLLENQRRDRRNNRELRQSGWQVFVVWQCQTRRMEWLVPRIVDFLGKPRGGC